MNIAAILAMVASALTGLLSHSASTTWFERTLLIGNMSALLFLTVSVFRLRESRQRQLAAESERQRFSLFVQNSSDLIGFSSPNAKRTLMYINKSGREMVGLSQDADVTNLPGGQFYPPEFADRFVSEVIPSIVTTGSYSGEFCYRHFVTGELIPVHMKAFPLIDPVSGEKLGTAVVSRDIRDRKNLEQQLDNFFKVSIDMLGIATVGGRFTKLNPAFTAVLGWSEEELCSRPATEFIHPDDIQKTIEAFQALADGRSVISFENRYRTKAGDYRWLSWKSSPQGDLIYGAARDITEEKNAQAMMGDLNKQAIAASKAKSEFLANMSHEIRTPINGVVGMTHLLMDTQLDAEQLDYVQNIKLSADALLIVINDILDFSKIEAGRLDFEVADFNLATLIEETAKSHTYLLRNKSIPLIMKIDRSDCLFKGDAGRIRQVIHNLLSNAVKFTHSGAIELAVEAVRHGETWTEFRFSVKDSGVGISSESQKKLFVAFSQADASTARKFGGTGLGLSISKRLVEMMSGQIGVESQEGEGSTFWFNLTFDHGPAIAPPKVKTAVRKTNYPHAHVLVAEDNFINQKIILGMLTKLGFTAQAVANGNEVLSALHEQTYDLILMDCQMPELDGYDATRRIRESGSLPSTRIPIIAMTANALSGDREKCLAAGMDDYASKPLSIDDLAVIVEKWLDKSSSEVRALS